MPYIIQDDRKKFKSLIREISITSFKSKGELEYVLFALLKSYMKERKVCYSELHDTSYACQHVADEFRRRYLDKRENDALLLNGDIEI